MSKALNGFDYYSLLISYKGLCSALTDCLDCFSAGSHVSIRDEHVFAVPLLLDTEGIPAQDLPRVLSDKYILAFPLLLMCQEYKLQLHMRTTLPIPDSLLIAQLKQASRGKLEN